jgi:hypothetical protein
MRIGVFARDLEVLESGVYVAGPSEINESLAIKNTPTNKAEY